MWFFGNPDFGALKRSNCGKQVCPPTENSVSNCEIHKGKHLGNLTLTKMHPTFAEKPRVRIGVVSVYMGLKIE